MQQELIHLKTQEREIAIAMIATIQHKIHTIEQSGLPAHWREYVHSVEQDLYYQQIDYLDPDLELERDRFCTLFAIRACTNPGGIKVFGMLLKSQEVMRC
jgi:hypothetical protein